MCIRYYVDYGTKQKICDLTGNPEALIRTGDIRPLEPAAILSRSPRVSDFYMDEKK